MIALGLQPEPRTAQETLCVSCIYSHIVRGYNGEELIACGYAYPPREVLFSVRECTDYTKERS